MHGAGMRQRNVMAVSFITISAPYDFVSHIESAPFLVQELHVLLPCRGRLTAISRWNVNLQCCLHVRVYPIPEGSCIVQIDSFVTEPQVDPDLDNKHRERNSPSR